MTMTTATKYDGTVFRVGDEVRYFSYADRWRFGHIIGLHVSDVGVNADGQTRATVRFNARGTMFPQEDIALVLWELERCKQHNEDQQENQMAY